MGGRTTLNRQHASHAGTVGQTQVDNIDVQKRNIPHKGPILTLATNNSHLDLKAINQPP